MKLTRTFLGGMVFAMAIGLAGAPLLGATETVRRPKTDSRATFVHRIPLLDEQGKNITPTTRQAKAQPYSPAQTCGKCHEYDVISHGWHFNAAEGKDPGRPGEPWILINPTTRTQLPLSYRGWRGTYKPIDVGMTDWQFAQEFGRHLPGGGIGDSGVPKMGDPANRWLITGKMNIDCLLCHSGDSMHDPNERAKQISYQNFRFAPAIALGLGSIKDEPKMLKSLPKDWDPNKTKGDDAEFDPIPDLAYDAARFEDGLVYMDITRRPPASRCYYCHTTQPAVDRGILWHSDLDVHIRAGMLCVDCHRNGIDHKIVRGYQKEGTDRNDTVVSSLSCRGCHMGVEGAQTASLALGGRLGAPRPEHVGLPTVHLEKLSCTACHSGSWPTESPQLIQTSLAHALGFESPLRDANSPPGIVAPVFLRDTDGTVAPHKVVWPNFWGRLHPGGHVKPIPPAEVLMAPAVSKPTTQPAKPAPAIPPGIKPVRQVLPQILDERKLSPDTSKPLTDEQIVGVLTALAVNKDAGEPVYISGGKMWRLENGKLSGAENPAAQPYAWPLAHDVRPAKQSLGSRGCSDCHATDSPISFGQVTAVGPVSTQNAASVRMAKMRGDSVVVATLFNLSFTFRPLLKILGFAAAAILLAVLVVHGLGGLATILGANQRKP